MSERIEMNINNQILKFDEQYSSQKMQTEKQRLSSIYAEYKYRIFAPNYYNELAGINRLGKRSK